MNEKEQKCTRRFKMLPRKLVWLVIGVVALSFADVTVIPTDATQSSPKLAYSYVWDIATSDQWVRTGMLDPDLANPYGERPILWIASGPLRGQFVFADTVPNSEEFDSYIDNTFDIDAVSKSYSLVVPGTHCVSILRSAITDDLGQSVMWESPYFNMIFQNLSGSSDSWVDMVIDSGADFSWNEQLVIIPAFEATGTDGGDYIREVATRFPELADALIDVLNNGGTIYAEGNGGYLLEALGIIPDGTVQIMDHIDGDPSNGMLAGVEITDSTHPLSFTALPSGLYTVWGPTLSDGYRTILRFTHTWDPADSGKPAAIEISGDDAHGGKILLVSGMPTAGIIQGDDPNQWQWSANAVLSAFAQKLLLVRSVHSPVVLPESTNVAPFAIPADDSVTIDITVKMRNLWDEPLSNLSIYEHKSSYLFYVDCPSGPSPTVSGNSIHWDISSLAANSEQNIVYRLRTPADGETGFGTIGDYITGSNYLRPSYATGYYNDAENVNGFEYRYDLWTKVLFSADIIADADLNWKNILGDYFQPFKIFMTMENKERTSALNTYYMQMIPLDVPIYWVAPEEIPIVRTPGGQFVDLLRGTADSTAGFPTSVSYDMDNDGDPDAWLDFSTIFPTPDSVFLDSVYWFNPWADEYEDIDGDGSRAQDLDGDGIVDFEEPGDKIRVWRCYWNIDEVPGYQWYDPYVSWELWIDPPSLMDMAKGAAEHLGYDRGDRDPADTGFYYPDWANWMEKDTSTGEPVLVRLIGITWGSYEGFRFERDTSYHPTPGDPIETDLGIIPYPRREYIAVLNLGGHEPTMTSPFPPDADTIYSKISYETIWGKHKTTPIRVSYTYYTPLPNPLQFEYVNQVYKITDPATGEELPCLPANGDANIDFKITASTEYSKYWIANVGKDLGQFAYDYTDPNGRGWTRTSSIGDSLGDGVFGYVMVTIPKGIGSYSFDIDMDNLFPQYETLIDTNPLVPTDVYIVEYPFKWELYCPQVLMPPALDDDNFDGVDDWDDDFGDRFVSPTGFLHDVFPPLDGEQARDTFAVNPWDTSVAIEGDLAHAHNGWCPGPDSTYGDDLPEKLGSTHLTMRLIWHGDGYEGLVKINDGATLVNEEIFGGSPWVQWSHALLTEAKGNNLSVWNRDVSPTVVSLYPDTIYLRYTIKDTHEPHDFDEDFDPYIVSASDENMNIEVRTGGKEPASLFDPDITMHARVDLSADERIVTNIADIPDSIVDAVGYVRDIDAALTTIIVEVDNASGSIWNNVDCSLDLSGVGETSPVFWYGVYPRPFVPAHYDESSGEWIPGDDPRTFHAGWRFNSSEKEVLFQYGNPDGSVTIPEVQSSRRVYYIFHLAVDPNLAQGIYDIPVTVSGVERDYSEPYGTGTPFSKTVTTKLASVNWASNPTPSFVIATAHLNELLDTLADYVQPITPVEARWSWSQPDPDHFDDGIYNDLSGDFSGNVLRLFPDAQFVDFPPAPTRNSVWVIVRSIIDAETGSDDLLISQYPTLDFDDLFGIERNVTGKELTIAARGPAVLPLKRVAVANGDTIGADGFYTLNQGDNELVIQLDAVNFGNDIASNPKFYVQIGKDAYFDGIDSSYTFSYDDVQRIVEIDVPDIFPGEVRTIPIWLAVPTTQVDSVLELCYAFTANFWGLAGGSGLLRATSSDDGRMFTEIDPDTIYYGANLSIFDNDIALSNQAPNIGDEIDISATVHFSGNTKFENVPVRLIAQDGTPLGSDNIIPLLSPSPDSIYSVNFQHTVGDYYEKLFIVVDPDSQFGEIKEGDNVATVEIFTGKGDPLRDVVNYPNPFKKYTEFVYTLTRPVKSLDIEVYTLRGRLIKKFSGSTTPGYNSVGWDGIDADGDPIANGSYIYKIIAKDSDGKKYEIRSVAVRMQ